MRLPSIDWRCGAVLINLVMLGLMAIAMVVAPTEALGQTGALALIDTLASTDTLASIDALAQSEAALHLPELSDKQRFLVGPILPSLQNRSCGQAVRTSVGAAAHMQDRVLVELRCGAPAWHMYVPVRIVGTSSAAVATHAIVAGSVLTAADLRIEQHNMTELPPGYLDNPSIAVGLTAARPISGGSIVTNQQLVAARAVLRGQAVTLVADAGGISVRMAGKALSDGLVNQRVRVQNLSSGKIVEGIVRSDQVVEIIFR